MFKKKRGLEKTVVSTYLQCTTVILLFGITPMAIFHTVHVSIILNNFKIEVYY